jgi:chromosomal replication initiation ATPase DnaA
MPLRKARQKTSTLFLFTGDSGLGKTHLLYASAMWSGENHPEYNIVYVKGERFYKRTDPCAAGRQKR